MLLHLGIVCGTANRFSQSEAYLRDAMTIYEQVYASMPEMLEEKRRDLGQVLHLLRKREKRVNP